MHLLGYFYTVLCRNMGDLGTPLYGRAFFDSILKTFPPSSMIFVVQLNNQPVAAEIASEFKGIIEVPWASSLREHRSLCQNMLFYWKVISFPVEQGFTQFYFGRSMPGEWTHNFQEQWDATAVPLSWEYWTGNAQVLPDLSPKNPKYDRAIKLWKRLPMAVANHLGPSIARNIP